MSMETLSRAAYGRDLIRLTPLERKQRLAQYLNANGARWAHVQPRTNNLQFCIDGVNHSFEHCPTFHEIRVLLGVEL